jgi:hypothetical protein
VRRTPRAQVIRGCHARHPPAHALSLAHAMLARARRAMERDHGDASVLDRVRAATAALARAVDKKEPRAAALTDDLSDALLDLV